jgi:hypothetical protein
MSKGRERASYVNSTSIDVLFPQRAVAPHDIPSQKVSVAEGFVSLRDVLQMF